MPFAQPADPVKENSPESDQTQDSVSLTSLVCILFAGTVSQSAEQTHRQARTRAEKLTGTQAEKQTGRQADRQTGKPDRQQDRPLFFA